jgi:hypothetical protein
MQPYACPSCRNKSRFHIMDQNPVAVKLDAQTGDILEYVDANDPLHIPYRGETRRIQCAVCGVTDSEQVFAKTSQRLR